MARVQEKPGVTTAPPPVREEELQPTRQRNWTVPLIALVATIGIIGAIVAAVWIVGRDGDNVSTAPASPAIAPQSEGVAPPVAAAPATAPVAPVVASGPAAPVAAVQQPATPAAPPQQAAKSVSSTTPYGVPHYTDPRKLQKDAGKFVDIQSGERRRGVPSVVTLQGVLWFAIDIDTRNKSWYLLPTQALNEPETVWKPNEVVRVFFSEKSADPETLVKQIITVRGEIPSSVSGISDHNRETIRLIILKKAEVVGNGP